MGITDSNEKDAEIKKAFFRAAKKRVLAVDSTKFDKISFVQISDLTGVDAIVTDVEPSALWKQNFAAAKVDVLY